MALQKTTKMKVMNLKNKTEKSADLTLYGDIGDDFFDEVSSTRLVQELNGLDVENINLYISSDGGGVMAAIAIANALKRHKAKVTAHIDGVVASAATVITSACDVVKMPKNTLFMIHNPWTIAMGEKKDFEKMAEVLSKVKNSIIETYVDKTGLEKEVLSKYMDEESWLSATQAKELGFVDEIIDTTKKEKKEEETEMNEEEKVIEDKVETKVENKIENNALTKEALMDILGDFKNQILKEVRTEAISDYRNESKPISNIGFIGEEKKETATFLGSSIKDIIDVMNGKNKEVE